MKVRIAGLTAVLALAFAAPASAHHYFYNATLSGTSNTNVSGVSYEAPQCGNWAVVSPGQTKYVLNGRDFIHFGWGRVLSFVDIHGDVTDDITTGPETRFFRFVGGSEVGTRRVWVLTGFGWLRMVKVVHQAGSNPVAVRINC